MKKTDDTASHAVYLAQVDHLAIRDIRLLESQSKLGKLRKDELPSSAKQSSSVRTRICTDEKLVVAFLDFRLEVSYEDASADEDPIVIHAVFGVGYEYKGIDPKLLSDTVITLATVSSWAYWREFVQSTTVRMGLPGFPIPIMSVNNLKKKIRENKKPPVPAAKKRKAIAKKK